MIWPALAALTLALIALLAALAYRAWRRVEVGRYVRLTDGRGEVYGAADVGPSYTEERRDR